MSETHLYVKKPIPVKAYQTDHAMTIHTLEGDLQAQKGDWIMTGVNGEQYPVADEIFKKTYERYHGNDDVKK